MDLVPRCIDFQRRHRSVQILPGIGAARTTVRWLRADRQSHQPPYGITQEINSAVEEQASGAQAVVRAMDKMRELVQQSASSSTELSAAAEQMLKLSRNLLDSMDRFVLDRHCAAGTLAPRGFAPAPSWRGNRIVSRNTNTLN